MTDFNGLCKAHSGIGAEIDNLKSTDEKQWIEIGKKASTTLITWAIGIFLVISMAVVSFLWLEQRGVRDRLESYQEKIIGERGILTLMDKKLDALATKKEPIRQ